MNKLEFDMLVPLGLGIVIKITDSLIVGALMFSFVIILREHYFCHTD